MTNFGGVTQSQIRDLAEGVEFRFVQKGPFNIIMDVCLNEFALDWFAARDALFGQNKQVLNVKLGMDLAMKCSHPDALWICKLAEKKSLKTKEELLDMLKQVEEDPRALCYMETLRSSPNLERMRMAADSGHGFACAQVASLSKNSTEKWLFAQKAVELKERDGLYQIFLCRARGDGCDCDPVLAKSFCGKAAILGHVASMTSFAIRHSVSEPDRWYWNLKGAIMGDPYWFVGEFCLQFVVFLPTFVCKGDFDMRFDVQSMQIQFLVGRGMHGHVAKGNRDFLGTDRTALIDKALKVIDFYKYQIAAHRKAVHTWTLVGIRNHVVKDIRRLIGEMIWKARENTFYEMLVMNYN